MTYNDFWEESLIDTDLVEDDFEEELDNETDEELQEE